MKLTVPVLKSLADVREERVRAAVTGRVARIVVIVPGMGRAVAVQAELVARRVRVLADPVTVETEEGLRVGRQRDRAQRRSAVVDDADQRVLHPVVGAGNRIVAQGGVRVLQDQVARARDVDEQGARSVVSDRRALVERRRRCGRPCHTLEHAGRGEQQPRRREHDRQFPEQSGPETRRAFSPAGWLHNGIPPASIDN